MFCTFNFFPSLFGLAIRMFVFRFCFVEKNGRCGSIHLLGGYVIVLLGAMK